MPYSQTNIEQLKQEFEQASGKKADKAPADFAAYLHLGLVEKLEKSIPYLESKESNRMASFNEIAGVFKKILR